MKTRHWFFLVGVLLFVTGIGFTIAGARAARQAPVVEAPITTPVATVKQIMKFRLDVNGVDYDTSMSDLIRKVEDLQVVVFRDAHLNERPYQPAEHATNAHPRQPGDYRPYGDERPESRNR